MARGSDAGGYRADIDGLRALAVGLVLVFHAFPAICRSGFIGVDVFFVLSGYLITRILLQRKDRFPTLPGYVLDFYQHRLRRIFPALIVVLVVVGVYGWFRLFPEDYIDLTQYIAAGAAFVSNFVLASESGYFDAGAQFKPLTHLWSLAIEEQFYIVWPLLILFISRVAKGRYLAPVLGALTVASFITGVVMTGTDPTLAYYSPLSRGWELGVGGLLAVLHARGISAPFRPRLNALVAGAALLLIPVAAFTFIDAAQFPGWQALVPVLATAAIIWFGRGTVVDRYLLGLRPVVWIGLISYPLYLWHWVLLSLLRIERPAPPGILTLAALGASVVLAAATYYLVERPLRRPNLRAVSIGVLVAMAVVFAAALTAHLTKWSGVQLTPTQQALSQTYDPRPAYRFGECFLDSATQSAADFAAACDPAPGDDAPTLLIWGDSLAAQLYPGLAATSAAHGHALAQRTATSCPPSVADGYDDRGNCDELNVDTREWIAQNRPETVVINARWPQDAAERRDELEEIGAFLRDNGAERVVLIGPAPDWQPGLRSLLIRMDLPGDRIPEFLPAPDTFPATVAADDDLRGIAEGAGIEYVSLVDLLCRDDDCRVTVSPEVPDGLITADHDHLTAQSSEFVFDELAGRGFWDD